jgi:hypothetical protein
MERQLKCSIRRPPTVGPTAGPKIVLMLKNPIAIPRFSGGNTLNNVNIDSDCSTPDSRPWTTRAATNTSSFGLSAATSSATTKTHSPTTKVLRCPKLAISQALSNCPTVWPARLPVDDPLGAILPDAECPHDVG